MEPATWTGIIGVILIGGVFYLVRRSVFLFSVLCAGIISTVILYNFVASAADRLILLGAGLILFAFGLLSVRTMLRRSVSLDMLRHIRASHTFPEISEPIAQRLQDATRYGLIRIDPECALTAWGRLISTLTAILYTFTRIRK